MSAVKRRVIRTRDEMNLNVCQKEALNAVTTAATPPQPVPKRAPSKSGTANTLPPAVKSWPLTALSSAPAAGSSYKGSSSSTAKRVRQGTFFLNVVQWKPNKLKHGTSKQHTQSPLFWWFLVCGVSGDGFAPLYCLGTGYPRARTNGPQKSGPRLKISPLLRKRFPASRGRWDTIQGSPSRWIY